MHVCENIWLIAQNPPPSPSPLSHLCVYYIPVHYWLAIHVLTTPNLGGGGDTNVYALTRVYIVIIPTYQRLAIIQCNYYTNSPMTYTRCTYIVHVLATCSVWQPTRIFLRLYTHDKSTGKGQHTRSLESLGKEACKFPSSFVGKVCHTKRRGEEG